MGYFLHFYSTKSPKNQNFEKMKKKKPWDIIILNICTKNYDQIMYDSWDMLRDRCNYFLVLAIFCPFTPRTAQKINILKKWEKHLGILSFYKCVPKIMIRWCTVPEIWCVTDLIIFHFGSFLPFYTPKNSPKNQNFEKLKNFFGDIIILHMRTNNYN